MAQSKIFVAGIAWGTTDEAFNAFFSAFGAVKEGIIMREQDSMRSRGFGFITYEDISSCDKVLSQDLQLDGRKLDIKMAVAKENMEHNDGAISTKKLYVAGVNFDTDDDGFFQFFSRFGDIESALIMKDKQNGKSRGFGFVTFIRETSVEAALHAHAEAVLVLDGRPLDVTAAYPRGSKQLMKGHPGALAVGGGPGDRLQSKKIFVAGLSATTNEETFMAYFEGFGKVTEATIMKDRSTGASRGFGFITFEAIHACKSVLKAAHEIDGKSVDCKTATPRPPLGGAAAPAAFGFNAPMAAYGGAGRLVGGPMGAAGYGGGRQASAMQRQQQTAMNQQAAYGMTQQPGMGGMGGAQAAQQFGSASQQAQSYGREAYVGAGFQPQNASYNQVGGAGVYEVSEDAGYSANGNPYGNAGNGYGAYAGAGRQAAGGRRGQAAGFHPYSR